MLVCCGGKALSRVGIEGVERREFVNLTKGALRDCFRAKRLLRALEQRPG